MSTESKLRFLTRRPLRSLSLSMLTVPLLCVGCSRGGDEVTLGTVTGVVTMDGKPLSNAIVIFAPEKGRPSSGRTDTSGYYRLAYNERAKGAVPGNHTVSIITAPPEKPRGTAEPEVAEVLPIDTPAENSGPGVAPKKYSKSKKPAQDMFPQDPIPEKYNRNTELKKEVVEGKNTINFELQSK